jgi:putative addiction module component (TIGR02574 family)
MSLTLDEVLEAAMALPEADRAVVAVRLQESLEGFASPEIAAAWDAEIARRIKEADEGTEPSIPMEEVDRLLRERHGFLTD